MVIGHVPLGHALSFLQKILLTPCRFSLIAIFLQLKLPLMKSFVLFTTLLLCAESVSASEKVYWGQTGHRVVGLVAEKHLSKKARKNIAKVLGAESLAMVANHMDFIKSDPAYKQMDPWHYCTIPDGKTYEEAGTPEEGDVIQTINRLIEELKTKKFTDGDEAFAIKMLVHLVGDIHQPLHVGTGADRGGNDVKLKYFWEDSNLHKVWDSGIIDNQQLSYTEFTAWIDHAHQDSVQQWQADGVLEWAYESVSYRAQVYKLPENLSLSYRYDFDNIEAVKKRLLQAGIRLAAILNEIYG